MHEYEKTLSSSIPTLLQKKTLIIGKESIKKINFSKRHHCDFLKTTLLGETYTYLV